jgi:hypothetical protein
MTGIQQKGGKMKGSSLREATLKSVGMYGAFLILGILVLSCFDLIFTIIYTLEGGQELNPLMASLLENGYASFSVVKMGLTVLGLMIFASHIELPRVRKLLTLVFVMYTGIVSFHVYLRLLAHHC